MVGAKASLRTVKTSLHLYSPSLTGLCYKSNEKERKITRRPGKRIGMESMPLIKQIEGEREREKQSIATSN